VSNRLIRAAEWRGGIETAKCSTMEAAQHKEECLITLENFSQTNRTRRIGNSIYRICRAKDDRGKWYIVERFNDGSEWGGSRALYCDTLQQAIEKLNSFTEEKELIRRLCEDE
jgi:quinol monooxygenase YgiN